MKFSELYYRAKRHVLPIVREKDSFLVTSKALISEFTSRPDFPFLVSFPRTGSHWLRMVMERYFEKPGLLRVFYYPHSRDFLAYHSHDMDLDVYRRNVIYLYRSPAATIYSQMRYARCNPDDAIARRKWTALYGLHLEKWLILEKVSEKKTIVKYEELLSDRQGALKRICEHLGAPFDADRAESAFAFVSKAEVAKKSEHDPQVIDESESYRMGRPGFLERYGCDIRKQLIEFNPKLEAYI